MHTHLQVIEPAPPAPAPCCGTSDVSRRRALLWITWACGGAIVALAGIPVVGFVFAPLVRPAKPQWQDVGKLESFAIGQTVKVDFSDPSPLPWAGITAKTAAWLRRVCDDEFIAFSINCRHLGCPVRWVDGAKLFMCPCHGGVYYEDGSVAAGPPPEPLARYNVRVHNGQVEIQTSPIPLTTFKSSRPNARYAAMVKSILVSSWRFIDDRTGASAIVVPMMKHIVPRDARWWYVFGSATLCCFIMQVLTGIGLAIAYVPSGGDAFESLRYITDHAPLGSVLRGMHFFGASAMVLLAVMHMAQVYLHAAYKYPREMNWMSGVVLLLFTLAMGFTGQLLRWDANGVWSAVVGAEQAARAPVVGPFIAHFILGGDNIGGATLTRFFVLHVFIFPAFIFAGVALHVFLILRHGISEMPRKGEPVDPKTYKRDYEARLKKTGVPFWPDAAWRDAVFSLIVVVGIVLCAVIFGPPVLDKPPDPTTLNVNPAPDWYFLFYFAILSMLPANLETWVILGGPLVVILALLFLPLISNKGDRAPSRRPWALATVVTAGTAIVIFSIYGRKAPWSPNFEAHPLNTVVALPSGPQTEGAQVFFAKGCIYCHEVSGDGGQRGPNLSTVGDRLTEDQLIIRINNGGHNMPAFAGRISRDELTQLVTFLKSRRQQIEPTARVAAVR